MATLGVEKGVGIRHIVNLLGWWYNLIEKLVSHVG
jgi:hypothetical protein